MNDDQVGRRFDRLEVKIDKLTEVMTDVARVEEKLVGQQARLKRHEYRIDENEKKLESITDEVRSNTTTTKIGSGVIASLWTALLGYLIYLFRG